MYEFDWDYFQNVRINSQTQNRCTRENHLTQLWAVQRWACTRTPEPRKEFIHISTILTFDCSSILLTSVKITIHSSASSAVLQLYCRVQVNKLWSFCWRTPRGPVSAGAENEFVTAAVAWGTQTGLHVVTPPETQRCVDPRHCEAVHLQSHNSSYALLRYRVCYRSGLHSTVCMHSMRTNIGYGKPGGEWSYPFNAIQRFSHQTLL